MASLKALIFGITIAIWDSSFRNTFTKIFREKRNQRGGILIAGLFWGEESFMKRIIYHIIIPAIMPAAFLVIASMPVEVLGCRTRGLIALLIAFVSGLAALGAAIMGVKGRMRGDRNASWWTRSTLILVMPVIALILLA